ncbi:NADPH dehydrogenase [mine drainage metagenome]|uniref:NADPH dehydrogenase n=1 Tax=mine drainage metagenome TaxID=410659 RepID=A0A1J5SDR7_9ZZZZ
MSQLFQPFKISHLTLKNRIVIAPMCQYSAQDGLATDWHLIHLGNLALSGAGLLMIEAAAVEPIGRITHSDLGLWSDETESALGKVLKSIRQYSSMPISIQLAHAGRKASSEVPWKGGQLLSIENDGWQTVAPSAIPFNESDRAPTALSIDALNRIKAYFVASAKRAVNIGIDAIEIHAAHGYLLHEFLSPLSNQRQDQYGGSLENRMCFPLEVFAAVKESIPQDFPLGIRISASDWVEGGWDIDQSIAFTKALEPLDCHFIHVSSGGLSPKQVIPNEPNYQVGFAESIRQNTKIPVIAVGLITDASQAEKILQEGKADLIALARGMLYDPRWPWHAAAELNGSVDAPPQYWRSQPRGLSNLFNK